MKQVFVIVSVLVTLASCDKTRSQDNVLEDTALHHQNMVWCPFDHDGIVQTNSDSVFVFTEEHGNGMMYTLIIKSNPKRHYNATFYEVDSLNPLYNVIDKTSGPKIFFEGIVFRVNSDRLNEIEKRLDVLFDETGPDSYKEMLDGWSFLVTSKGRSMRVNRGPMLDKWKEYSIFLQESVVRPYKELREKGRRGAELNQR